MGYFVRARWIAGLVRCMRYDPDTFGDHPGWSNEPSDEQKQAFYGSTVTLNDGIEEGEIMGFIAIDNGGTGNFKRVPAGVFIGRCYQLIDMGTQLTHTQDGEKMLYKIRIGWELFGDDENGEPLEIEVAGKVMPLTINKTYTLSLHSKSGLRKDLKAWRGKDFTDEEAKAFDVSKLLGAYCMVSVTQNESNGKTYSNVETLTPIPGALKNSKPQAVHENVMFNLDSPNMEVFETFHEWLKEAIKKSPEFAEFTGSTKANKEFIPSDQYDDSDIPFCGN
jgi:hypothetical protein